MKRATMKKLISTLLAAALALTVMLTPTLAASEFRSDDLGFSLLLPAEYANQIEVRRDERGIVFIHTPSIQDNWYGRMGSIEVVTPRSAYLTENFSSELYTVIGMSADSIYLYRGAVGGIDAPEATREAYIAALDALDADYLRENIRLDKPEKIPALFAAATLPIPAFDSDEGREIMTRGEIAMILYDLLDAENKSQPQSTALTDLAGRPCAQAVGYLHSYGMIAGYPDGTFRPEAAVTRAEFVVLLHRLVFAPVESWYGDGINFADINTQSEHWALAYLTSACNHGLLSGYPDGTLRPDGTITRFETYTLINRLLTEGADALTK